MMKWHKWLDEHFAQETADFIVNWAESILPSWITDIGGIV